MSIIGPSIPYLQKDKVGIEWNIRNIVWVRLIP